MIKSAAVHHERNEAQQADPIVPSKLLQIDEAPVMGLSKGSSTKSKKVKSKASKESFIPRRQSDQSLSSKKRRNGSRMKRNKSFAEQPSSPSSDTTDSSTLSPPFCIENKGLSPNMLASRNQRSSLAAESIMTLLPPKGSSTKSKKVRSKASMESSSSIPRRQSDQCLSNKKKRNGSSIKRSKSFGEQLSSASSGPTVSAASHVVALPKGSPSMKSKKVRFKGSKACSIPRRQSDQFLLSSKNTKRKVSKNSMKRSKSFDGQSSLASSEHTNSSAPLPASMLVESILSTKKPKQINPVVTLTKRPMSTKTKKLKSKPLLKTSSIPRNGSKQKVNNSSTIITSSGMKRSKSFGDKTGTIKNLPKPNKRNGSGTKGGMKRTKSVGDSNGTKSLIDLALSNRISNNANATKKDNANAVWEHLTSNITPMDTTIRGPSNNETKQDPSLKNKSSSSTGRRVHFRDKVRFKTFKHSKVDPGSIWYSHEEIEALREREQEVKRQARSCHNSTLLNIEGLMTISERNAMFERQIESREAVYEVQNAHRLQKELMMATSASIFQESSAYDLLMESSASLSNYYDQDEAIAEEYEIYTAAAIQCAQQRATHLALHVNLLWDQNFEFAGTEGWHEIKLVGTPSTNSASTHRLSSQMLMLAG